MSEPENLTGEDWPEPVVVLNETGTSDIVFICEHASNHMPASFGKLGLPDSDLERHIAWDIGAEAVTRGLSERLNAVCFLGTYSRLLIDLNRPIDSETCIPVRSESTVIPGNIDISADDRTQRVKRIFHPFHDRIVKHLDKRLHEGKKTTIVAIHSFTPTFLGNKRQWHAGILFNQSRQLANRMISALRYDGTLSVEANVPYVIDRRDDYAIPVHGEDRGLDAILVEIRQDLIHTVPGQMEWADRIAKALEIPPR